MCIYSLNLYFRNGQPKGIAFLEYENEKSAQNAILKMDDTELNGSKVRSFIYIIIEIYFYQKFSYNSKDKRCNISTTTTK